MIFLGVIVIYLNDITLNIKPAVSSKITTCLQFITLIMVLSKEYLGSYLGYYNYLYYLTALFTIISFLQYLYQWFQMMGEKQENMG